MRVDPAQHRLGFSGSGFFEFFDTDEWEKKPPPEPVRRRSVGRGGYAGLLYLAGEILLRY
jgi:hypothetical protein